MRLPTRILASTLCLALAATAWLLVAQTVPPTLASSNQIRYLASNTTGTAALSEGRTATAPTNPFSMGPVSGGRQRYANVIFFGAGTAGQTITYKVWAYRRAVDRDNVNLTVDYDRRLFCSGTATLGATAGVLTTTKGISTTDLIADTLTCVVSGYGASICVAYAAVLPFAHSPGGGSEAQLFMPDLGNSVDFELELQIGTATNANALIERGT